MAGQLISERRRPAGLLGWSVGHAMAMPTRQAPGLCSFGHNLGRPYSKQSLTAPIKFRRAPFCQDLKKRQRRPLTARLRRRGYVRDCRSTFRKRCQ